MAHKFSGSQKISLRLKSVQWVSEDSIVAPRLTSFLRALLELIGVHKGLTEAFWNSQRAQWVSEDLIGVRKVSVDMRRSN